MRHPSIDEEVTITLGVQASCLNLSATSWRRLLQYLYLVIRLDKTRLISNRKVHRARNKADLVNTVMNGLREREIGTG